MCTTPNVGENMEQQELLFIGVGNAKWYDHCGGSFGSFIKLNIFLIFDLSVILWDLPEGVGNIKPHKNLPIGIYSSFLCNCQNLKQQRCPLTGE